MKEIQLIWLKEMNVLLFIIWVIKDIVKDEVKDDTR